MKNASTGFAGASPLLRRGTGGEVMNRSTFLRQCGGACVSTAVFAALLESCASQKPVVATYNNNQLIIPLQSFYSEKNGEKKFRRSVMVRHEKVDYPIIIYRKNENQYKALLLRCTHQGQELNVHGDLISCSAHGSEFSNTGEVMQGPAETPLQTYRVHADSQNVYITL